MRTVIIFSLFILVLLTPISIVEAQSYWDNFFKQDQDFKNKTRNEEIEKAVESINQLELNVNSTPTQRAVPATSTPSQNTNNFNNQPQFSNFQPSDALERLLPPTTFRNSQAVVNSVKTCLNNKAVYMQVEAETGVPWKLIAGIHYVEANCDSARSCASGRAFGVAEPDRGFNCSQNNVLGEPKPVSGGCGFANLLDTCVFGANHLKRKAGNNLLSNVQTLARAVSSYNGGGNRNCGRISNVSMPYCPPEYEGADDIYTFKGYDEKRETMYLRYCNDGVLCNPPKPWGRIGVFTVVKNLSQIEQFRL